MSLGAVLVDGEVQAVLAVGREGAHVARDVGRGAHVFMLVCVLECDGAEAAVTVRSRLRPLRNLPSDGDGIGEALRLVLVLGSLNELHAVLALNTRVLGWALVADKVALLTRCRER